MVSSLVVGSLVVTTVAMGDVHLSVDEIIALDEALTRKSNSPFGLSFVLTAALLLAVIIIIIILDLPIEVVVRDVGVVNIGLAVPSVRFDVHLGGGNGNKGEYNNSDL